MSETLVGLDGRPLDDTTAGELVTPTGYMEHLGRRTGMSLQKREFLKKNLPSIMDGPPQHMSRSQRQIAALQQACLEMSIQNLQLWGLLAAFAEAAGGKATFPRVTLDKFQKPENWPVVLLDEMEDGSQAVTVKMGEFKGVAKDSGQLPLPLEGAGGS